MKLLGAFFMVSAVAGSAYADRDAVDVMVEAAARSNAGDHAGAIELYERVFTSEGDFDALVFVGSEYRKLGQRADAIRYYCTYLSLEPTGSSAPFAASEVWTMQAEVGNMVPPSTPCVPAAPVNPAVGTSVVETNAPGSPAVETNAPGSPAVQTTTPMSPAVQTTTPMSPAVQATTLATPSLTPLAVTDRWAPWRQMINRETIGLGTAAVGVVALGLGVAFGMQAHDISEQINNHPVNQPWDDGIKQLEDRGQSAETLQNVFLVTGTIAATTGVILYVTGRANRVAKERVSVKPSVSKGAGGIAISGAF